MIDIKNSPNYDAIVNFLYEENDIVSKLLIQHYQEYLLWVKNRNSKKNMDKILKEYTEKDAFYHFAQERFSLNNHNDLLDSYDKVMRRLLKVYHEYENEKYRKINSARWI